MHWFSHCLTVGMRWRVVVACASWLVLVRCGSAPPTDPVTSASAADHTGHRPSYDPDYDDGVSGCGDWTESGFCEDAQTVKWCQDGVRRRLTCSGGDACRLDHSCKLCEDTADCRPPAAASGSGLLGGGDTKVP
jgi:hypothetical protein